MLRWRNRSASVLQTECGGANPSRSKMLIRLQKLTETKAKIYVLGVQDQLFVEKEIDMNKPVTWAELLEFVSHIAEVRLTEN